MTKRVRKRKQTSTEPTCPNLSESERLKSLFLLLEKIDKRQNKNNVFGGKLL